MPARLLVVANPNASRFEQFISPALGSLAAAGLDLDLRQPTSCEHLDSIVREGAEAADAIVIGGGDGTINAGLPALLDARKPVGILPLGTANDLALTLGIPVDPVLAAAIIIARRTRPVDVGRVNDRLFLNVASIGLSVTIAERQQAERKRQWGLLSYALTTLEVLGEADRFHATIICDGRSSDVSAFQIAIGNGVHYGAGMTIAEDAAIDDGLLDVYAIETRSIADLIALAPALMAGTHGRSPDVTVFRCSSVTVKTDGPMPVNTDGEVTTQTPAEFSVERAALDIFAPPPDMRRL